MAFFQGGFCQGSYRVADGLDSCLSPSPISLFRLQKHNTHFKGSFQDDLACPVLECQTILDFAAEQMMQVAVVITELLRCAKL